MNRSFFCVTHKSSNLFVCLTSFGVEREDSKLNHSLEDHFFSRIPWRPNISGREGGLNKNSKTNAHLHSLDQDTLQEFHASMPDSYPKFLLVSTRIPRRFSILNSCFDCQS